MSVRAFLDTNVFIYFYSDDDIKKRDAALKALNDHTCVTSIQAFNEVSNVWFNKFGWSGHKIKKHLDNIELVCDDILLIQRDTINKALALKGRYQYSYYDCLMLASALDEN